MKITISKHGLLDAIKTVQKIIPSNSPVFEISQIYLKGKNNKVIVAATDLTTYVKYTIQESAIFDGTFEFLIDATKLEKIAALCDNFVEIELTNGRCTINALQGKFSLPTESSASFPDKDKAGTKIADFSGKENLMHHIKKAIGFVSTDDLRPAMCGVNLAIDNDKLSVQATNANILYKHDTKCQSKEEKTNIIVPTKTAKILSACENDNFSLFHIDGYEYMFQLQNVDIYFFMTESRFPDVTAIIPQMSSHLNVFSFKKSELIKTLNSAMITANKASNAIRVYLNDNSAKFASFDIDNNVEGEIEIQCTVEKKQDDFKFAVNGNFLLALVNSSNIQNSDNFTFYMREANKALCFYSDNDSTITICMPLIFKEPNEE